MSSVLLAPTLNIDVFSISQLVKNLNYSITFILLDLICLMLSEWQVILYIIRMIDTWMLRTISWPIWSLSQVGILFSEHGHLDIMGYIDVDFASSKIDRKTESLLQGTLHLLEVIWWLRGVRNKTWHFCLV